MKIIYGDITDKDALNKSALLLLSERRSKLNKDFFNKLQDKECIIHHLLPAPTLHQHETRNKTICPIPDTKTDRFKNSFIPYSLSHYQ